MTTADVIELLESAGISLSVRASRVLARARGVDRRSIIATPECGSVTLREIEIACARIGVSLPPAPRDELERLRELARSLASLVEHAPDGALRASDVSNLLEAARGSRVPV